ncbi:hypothetical protein CKF54_01610 [Psittacicella hinzii]|uniref:Uncharacterized protein n=1 Tax=Psittacicella hinzii TaxID=2028575 RepID=A0A3A1YD75_9GAMM|nr:hypothetical protein [Psittacicella hinzii]RIY34154.1 hypothetical protein CKF54_01610 [Psittacicella hinzii]
MSLRTPRFKNEFLALQNLKVTGNLAIKNDLSTVVDKAIIEELNKENSKLTFSILDFAGDDFQAKVEGNQPVVFEKDIGKQGVDAKAVVHPYQRNAYTIKYFLNNLDLKVEEEREFFVNLVKNSIAFTSSFSYVERQKVIATEKVSSVQAINNYITLGMSNYYMEMGDLEKCTSINEQFRGISKSLLNTVYDNNYNIFTGTKKVSYVDLRAHSKDQLFKFMYAYLYRLYDLTVNKKLELNTCVVISGLRSLLDLASYQSFYTTAQGAADRLFKIRALLTELLERGKEHNLYFILLDINNQDYDEFSNYCFAIESEIGSLEFNY